MAVESVELLRPENVSAQVVKEILAAAFMDATIDSDGDVKITSKYKYFIQVPKSRNFLRIMALFSAQASTSRANKLEYANKVNTDLHFIRAYFDERGFVFDTYVPVQGGLTPTALIGWIRRFEDVLGDAGDKDEWNAVG